MSVSQIAVELSIPRPTAARLVATLKACGYLRYNPYSRKYSLGVKTVQLAKAFQGSVKTMDLAMPILKALHDKMGETAYINIVDDDERVCIVSLGDEEFLLSIVPVGQRSPLYAGADGKVLLAYHSPKEVAKIIERGLERLAPNTITNPNTLNQELTNIRKKGVAISKSEYRPGVACVACPVWDESGQVAYSIAISIPESRATESFLETCAKQLRTMTLFMSKQLGANLHMLNYI